MKRINYVGSASTRVVRDTDFATVGLTSSTLIWSKANNYQQDVSDIIAAFLLAVSPSFQEETSLTFGDMFFGNLMAWAATSDQVANVIGANNVIPGLASRQFEVSERPVELNYTAPNVISGTAGTGTSRLQAHFGTTGTPTEQHGGLWLSLALASTNTVTSHPNLRHVITDPGEYDITVFLSAVGGSRDFNVGLAPDAGHVFTVKELPS